MLWSGEQHEKGPKAGRAGCWAGRHHPAGGRGGIEVLSGSSRGPEALKAFSQFGAFSRWWVWVGSRHPGEEAVVLGSWKALSSPGFSGVQILRKPQELSGNPQG